MNTAMLEQVKKGLIDTIEKEGLILTMKTYPTKDNGFGIQIFDYSQAPIEKQAKFRIALDKSAPAVDGETSFGLSSNLNRIIESDYRTPMIEGAIIVGLEREYKIGEVTPLIKFGNKYGYQAVLIEGG